VAVPPRSMQHSLLRHARADAGAGAGETAARHQRRSSPSHHSGQDSRQMTLTGGVDLLAERIGRVARQTPKNLSRHAGGLSGCLTAAEPLLRVHQVPAAMSYLYHLFHRRQTIIRRQGASGSIRRPFPSPFLSGQRNSRQKCLRICRTLCSKKCSTTFGCL
jgi:hypothetical protein